VTENTLKLKVVLNNGSEKFKLFFDLAKENSEWFVQKLCNLATIHREYQALNGIGEIGLRDVIISPAKAQAENYDYFSISETLQKTLKQNYNDSQYKAMKASLKKEGITLIQGPPGTGKTSTILGILSVLLGSKQKNSLKKGEVTTKNIKIEQVPEAKLEFSKKKPAYMKAMPWLRGSYSNWRDDDKGEIQYVLEKEKIYADSAMTDRNIFLPPKKPDHRAKPEKILICAPSNAAIDEVVRVLDLKGLYDENGNHFKPFFIRVGPNYHPSLKDRALETVVNLEMQAIQNKENENEFDTRNTIIKRAKIVCSTLSVAGSSVLIHSGETFDTVIIDEAAQGVELSTLIPLKYSCKRLILIGDPNQLPATIFSKKCGYLHYDRSLFQRLQKVGYKSNMLRYQYRMHPHISKFISSSFYRSKLLDYKGIMDLIGQPATYNSPILQPCVFFHIEGTEEIKDASYFNQSDIDLIKMIYEFLQSNYKSSVNFERVGVISAYSSQVGKIRKAMNAEGYQVEVNTVDGFQGREKDIVIFSTVRSFGDQAMHQNGEKAAILNSNIFFWFYSLAIVQTQVEVRAEMPDADKEKMPRDEAVKLQKKEWKAYKQEVEKRTKATLQEKYGLEGVTDSIFFLLSEF
jgi:senataxin